MLWQTMGLGNPATVAGATNRYFQDQDSIAQWVEDRCEVDTRARTPPSELYESWRSYAVLTGVSQLSQRSFLEELSRRGFCMTKSNGVRYRTGLRLQPPTFDMPGAEGSG